MAQKTEAQKLADKAIAFVKDGYAYLNDNTLEYLAYGYLAESLTLLDHSADNLLLDTGLDVSLVEREINKRKAGALTLYAEAITLVRKHFNTIDGE